jgi:hypothetical protein
MSGGRDADEHHVRLHRVVHLAVTCKSKGTRLLRQGLGALGDDIAHAGDLNIIPLNKMVQVVTPDPPQPISASFFMITSLFIEDL